MTRESEYGMHHVTENLVIVIAWGFNMRLRDAKRRSKDCKVMTRRRKERLA